jgi:hypothetical protein
LKGSNLFFFLLLLHFLLHFSFILQLGPLFLSLEQHKQFYLGAVLAERELCRDLEERFFAQVGHCFFHSATERKQKIILHATLDGCS